MEGTWRHVKCSSTWTSPMPSSPPPPALTAAEPLQVSATVSVNQIDMNSRQFLLPFIPERTTLENRFAVQEPLVPHTLNIDFAKSGNDELGHSIHSLLSTNPHHLCSEFSQLTKLCAHSNGISSATPGVQLRSIPSSSQSSHSTSGSMWKAKIRSFDESRSSLVYDTPNATEIRSTLQISTCKQVPSAFQDISVGKAFMSCSWPANARTGNTGKHQPLNIKTNQTSQTMPTEAGSTVPSDSAHSRGCPRVICMKTVGELFLSELGLLGVVCFCHNMRMSVAKFCEHSGYSANPSDAVHLENGMTIAWWRKLCFGSNAPDDDKGWEWSDGPSVKNSFIKSWSSSYPTLPQNPNSADSVQTVVGFAKSGDPRNKSSYAMLPCTGVQQASIKYPINKVADNVHHNNRLEREGFISPSTGHVPVLAKSLTVHAVKENTNCLNSVALCSTLNKGEQNAWSRFIANSDSCKGKFGTQSLCDPHTDVKSLTHESSSSRNSFANEALMVPRDGNSSNIDLHLGQPSQVHNSLSSLSTAMDLMDFGARCNPPKFQENSPLTENTDHSRETKKPRIGLWCPSSKSSITHRGPSQHTVGSSNAFSHSEPKELAGNATKSSLISLFLSHLNTEGSSASQLTTIVDNSKLYMLDSASTKCIHSEHISGINGDNKRNNFLDGSELSDNLDKGKRPIIFEKGVYHPVKANFMAHGKKTTDTSDHVQATGGQCLHSGSSMDNKRFSLHFNQPTRILHNRPVSVNSNQYGKDPFDITGHYNCATNGSTNPALYSAAIPGPLNFGTPMNPTSSNSLFISESALTHAKSIDISQHLTDNSIKTLVLRPMIELSTQEQSTTTLEGDPRNQRLCCHSSAELQRNLCAGDSAAVEDLRHEAYRDTQQTASEFTVRSARSCSNCFSSIGAEMLANKRGTRGQSEFCNCTILTQRHSQCSKEQNISACHVCCANKHPCLRLGRMPNCSSCSVNQTFNQKEQTTPFYGKCCCSMLAKHLTSCCLSGNFSPSDSKERICGKAGIKHITQASDDVHICHDRKSSDLCECRKKHLGIKNDGQTGFWRDVPAKKVGHSDAISTDKPAYVLKSSRGTGDRLQGAACKGSEARQQEVDSINEQQMSNVCSGSPAPAATDISVEVNKGNYRAASFEDNKNACVFVADEGSGVEKCGSSDGALCIRKSEETPVNYQVRSDESGYSLADHSSGDIIDELRLQTSSNKNYVRNHLHIQCANEENFKMRKVWKEEKRKAQMKMKKLDLFFPESGSSQIISESSHCASHLKWELSSPDESKSLSQPENIMGRSSVKRKRTFLFSSEPLSVNTNYHHNFLKSDKIQSVNADQSLRTLAVLSEKEELTVRGGKQFSKQEGNHFDSGKPPKYMSLNCIVKYNNCETEIVDKKVRPVVCGKSGIISNGVPRGPKKAVKIVSLSLILKRSKRCDRNEYGEKSKKPVNSKARKVLNKNNGSCNGLTSWKVHCKNEVSAKNRIGPTTICMSSTNNRCFKKSDEHIDGFSVIDNNTDSESKREEDPALHHERKISQIKPRYKEVRRCSLSKLLGNDKHSTKLSDAPNSGTSCTLTMTGTGEQRRASSSTAIGDSLVGFGSGERSLNNEDHEGELSQLNTGRSAMVQNCQASLLSSDASCCVCGSSNKEDINCLLECNRCLIRVHQACYGVSKVPRGHWFCRPCKTNSQSTVCVLCGYDGGAMARAVKSQSIVKSLLKAWNFGTFMKSISSSEKVEAVELSFVSEVSKHDNSGSVTSVRSTCSEFPEASVDLTSENRAGELFLKGLQMYNSITAGVLDPSVTQWVHMVCGLWTPGTRCSNADTMSAFDVSGASASRKSTVCSMCNRPGGCCIQCRVPECPDHFHPWCAHQKGLLKSELEGDDNEMVGFYGRCALHAAQDGSPVDNHPVDNELESPKNDWSCARTVGFEGWKSGERFKSKHLKPPNDNGGCTVSQEQRNAWLHINGQNSCKRAVVKPSCSDFEYDFWESSSNLRYWKKVDRTCTLLNQKEYFRYKQSKAWKRLVVYKSGIHALGLYTSEFIAWGAMVVEYVGEIVGQRVADKREIEYQSGRKLQYKSACYFFRIDKEHIIDATRKGGIARFVNHSCQPNCVAKIISVRNDKKGLLKSELEGDDNEMVGFYGRCALHAAQDGSPVDNHPVDNELESPKNDWSCARTVGFEGWKSGERFKSKHLKPPNDNGGCTVSQEQRNAWLHINGQNSCKRAVVKPSCSDFEYDFWESSSNLRYWKKVDRTCTLLNQKEYFRYKQSKAWKRLVVYKSGIHALGLYTSEFIAWGAMVVEYVGEIVGQRVADKREIEYQSGRKLQYKSACYFFRIDKEHIIDATRKGGIARFVNHSCQPNCVAKIISVRNDKKGLLKSELEGDDNEMVGFYGRCALHAAQDGSPVDNHPVDNELESPKNDWSCARTVGFEGWKSGERFKSKHLKPPNDNGGCTVSQEQRNAWLHINGQNSCKRAVVKPSCSDFEYDFWESSSNLRYWKKVDRTCTLLNQKEYFRYKQSKAWKRLVVYKSGIHALGLYTSEFIAWGAMVVEYVGEIVGQRVADKREIEYQSGRKLQYKSACYFFRIDKEHIIDATRKGGIARFVNHSCQPNCVAKIISVRNDKKVVFFAERDIYPGEEITYDYHFNNEEGDKIPCYCNSKNCRQYLN